MPTEIIPSNIRDLCDDKTAADILDVTPEPFPSGDPPDVTTCPL